MGNITNFSEKFKNQGTSYSRLDKKVVATSYWCNELHFYRRRGKVYFLAFPH